MDKTVVSLGGSIFAENMSSYLMNIINLFKRKESYAIVVGGGPIARERIDFLRRLGATEYHLDKMGIHATRLNAMTVSLALGNSMEIPRTIDEAISILHEYGRVVMGGTEPGHTTDAVSVLLAEAYGADNVLNVTNVDSLYDRNPKLSGAKKIAGISYTELINMITAEKRGAGANFPTDILSLSIAMRSNIKIKILSYKDVNNISRALDGTSFEGTLISNVNE